MTIMYLIESHTISKNHSLWKECDRISLASKNLYNRALYLLKQELDINGKIIPYNNMYHLIKHDDCFKALPNVVSNAVLMQLNREFMSFFKAIKSWKKDKTKFKSCPKLPKFKHKDTGRNVVIINYRGCRVKKGELFFNKHLKLKLKTKVDKVVEVIITPQSNCYKIQVCYEKEEKSSIINDNYMSIDLGLNNLATCVTTNLSSFIINGKPLKAINHYYNSKKAKVQSSLKKNHNKYTSKRTKKLDFKRGNKVNNYLHKASKEIITKAINENISQIVIGYNKEWKQDINIGKVNNQNFVQIPYLTFINQIKYKAKLNGIIVLQHEESYTSKCSALDLEQIKKHDFYLGKRIKRGLFKSSNDKIINADCNGSVNIMRKEFGEMFSFDQIQGFVVNPIKINLNK